MKPVFFSYLLFGFFLAPAVLTAQVKFSTVPGSLQIHLNDVLQVTYTIENAKSVEDFRLPAFRDFKVVQGPVRSEGSMITNGVYSHYSGITYVLQPLRKGSLPLSGATALIDGQKMTSNKVVIDVGDKVAKTPNPYPRNPGVGLYRDAPEEDYILKPKENASQKIKDNLLVTVESNKKTAYVGEPIVATYKLYTRLRSNSRVTKWPSLNGFSVYDMLEPDRTSVQVETRNGKKFMSHIIRKIQLVPLQEGDFALDPVELDNQVQFLRSDATGNSSRSGESLIEKMFEGFFDRPNGTPESYQVSLSSTPQTMHIKPLPADAPESFNGAVGHFSISGRLVDSSTHAGDPVQYDLRVEGTGNLPLVTAPEWKLPAGLHLIDPTVTDTINKSVAPMEGRKTFRYSIMPDAAGTILLPAIEFSYFDPATAAYKTLRTDSAVLIVEAGKAPQNMPKNMATAPRKFNGWLIGAAASAPLVFALLLLLYRRKRKPGIPAAPAEIPEEIPPVIHDPLLPAKNALASNDATAYFHGIQTGLWEVVTDTLSLPGSAQQQPQALQQLAARGLPEYAVRELREIWNTCDWILYLPAASHQVNPGLLPRAEALVQQIRAL